MGGPAHSPCPSDSASILCYWNKEAASMDFIFLEFITCLLNLRRQQRNKDHPPFVAEREESVQQQYLRADLGLADVSAAARPK